MQLIISSINTHLLRILKRMQLLVDLFDRVSRDVVEEVAPDEDAEL